MPELRLRPGLIDIEEVEGVGKVTAQRLREHGIFCVQQLVYMSAKELAEIVGDETRAETILKNAFKLLSKQGLYKSFRSAEEVLRERESLPRIKTHVKALDEMLGGGLEARAIYELVGEFGAGKTQFCHHVTVTAQLPEERGGRGGKIFYIDTEGTFRPERIIQIAKRFELEPREALRNIYYARAYNTDHLLMLVEEAAKQCVQDNIVLIVVDSVIAPFRAEYPGRENLAPRQQKLNQLLHRLHGIADAFNVTVIITNQVQANPGGFFGDTLKPAGGHVLAHASTYRIWLRKSKENIRIAKIFDSPLHPEREVQFKITDSGLEDLKVESEKKHT
jgi:DNA repair protein RadA